MLENSGDNSKNIIMHLPYYLQTYREIIQIMTVENPEIELLDYEIFIIMSNQFINSCDITGIRKFEELLGIIPNVYEDLEIRIARVLYRWNDNIPYTHLYLIYKLDLLCGVGNYELVINNDLYKIDLMVYLGEIDNEYIVKELEELLSSIIPANMILIVQTVKQREIESEMYIGGVSVEVNHFTYSSN